jgi:hypothetical protein
VVTGRFVVPASTGTQTCLWLAKQLILGSFLADLLPNYYQ